MDRATNLELDQSLSLVLGDVTTVDLTSLGLLIGLIVICIFQFSLCLEELDLISMGEELAASKGVEVEHFRLRTLVCGSLLTAICGLIVGPIALVGVVAGYAAQKIFNNSFREMVPASFFVGGMVLLLCDLLNRGLLFNFEFPIGLAAVFLLSPLFLYLLYRESRAGLTW